MANLKTNMSGAEEKQNSQISALPGEKYFHYNQTGSLFWGMGEFTVTEARCCCEEHGYFVNMTSVNNDGSVYTKSVYKKEFEQGYFKNELDAWKTYRDDLREQLRYRKIVITRLESEVSEAQARIDELSGRGERP